MITEIDNLKFKRNLTALVEFSRIINSSFDLQFILDNVLLTCMGKFLAARGVIALNIDGYIKIKSSKGIADEIIKSFPQIPAQNGFLDSGEFKSFITSGKLCTIEKISSSNDMIGLLCLGEKLNKSPYSEDDIEFLKTILNIAATAIQNSLVLNELQKVNRMLDSRIHRLGSLFELSKEFGLLGENERISKLLVYSLIGQFMVSRFAVVLADGESYSILENKFPEDLLNAALSKMDITLVTSSFGRKEIIEKSELSKLNIELVVPMQLQGETKGLILLGRRINNSEFTEADIEFVYSVGSLAIISLENMRLFSEELEKQKMEEELEIARDIQRNLLPHSIPQYDRFDIAALNISSKQVGGDFYDIIPLDENHFAFAIADVSGKGVPAALLMANLQAFLKVICSQGVVLTDATALINDLVTENTMDGKFITFFWGVLNNEDLNLSYVNAGHNHPLMIRNGKLRKLDKGGIILGVMKTFIPYESETISLQKDDVIVLFTDGITEAKNKLDDEYSDEKLEDLVIQNSGKSADEIMETIKNSVQRYAQGTIQSDDITLIVIKVK